MEVLIVKLAALGDVLRTTSLLKPLHRRYPGCRVWWLTRADAKPLLEKNPLIYKIVLPSPQPSPASGRGQGEGMRGVPWNRGFDLVLSLEEDKKTAALAERVCSGEFVGVRSENGKLRYTQSSALYYGMSLLNSGPDGNHKTADALKAANRKTYAELWLDVLRLPRPKREADLRPILALAAKDRRAAHALAKQHGLRGGRAIGFNPGAGRRWTAKQISVDRSAEILDALHNKFKRPLILFGGKDEAPRNQAIIKRAKSPVIDAGTSHGIREFAGLLDFCGLVISTDSLAFHIATALGKPAVVLVGPTSASELDVFGRGRILSPARGCACFYLPRCRYETSCLQRLPIADILRAVGACLK